MQNIEVRNQEPQTLWNHFADINAIPRASKKEEENAAACIFLTPSFSSNVGGKSCSFDASAAWKTESVGSISSRLPTRNFFDGK